MTENNEIDNHIQIQELKELIERKLVDNEDSEMSNSAITADLLSKVLNNIHPSEQTNESLRTISRLNLIEIFELSCGNSMDSIRLDMGLKPRYSVFIIDYLANLISEKGKGREENIATAKITNDAVRNESEMSFRERALDKINPFSTNRAY